MSDIYQPAKLWIARDPGREPRLLVAFNGQVAEIVGVTGIAIDPIGPADLLTANISALIDGLGHPPQE